MRVYVKNSKECLIAEVEGTRDIMGEDEVRGARGGKVGSVHERAFQGFGFSRVRLEAIRGFPDK